MSQPSQSLSSPGHRAISGMLALLLVLGLAMLALAADSILNAFLASAATAPAATTSAQNYTVTGKNVAIWNLAGEVVVDAGKSAGVVVHVDRQGRDRDQLEVLTGAMGTAQTLRIRYPSNRVIYPPMGRGSNTELSVRSDGTFGGDSWKGSIAMSDRVGISGSGNGLEAYANLRVSVPAGQQVSIYLGTGRMTASNVNGTIRLDTASGDIEATSMKGSLIVDTGSGSVNVTGMQGPLSVDTGSGDVELTGISMGDLSVDTGSGSIRASDLSVDDLECDTGSGEIELNGVRAKQLSLDTGSGSVDVGLIADTGDLMVDTGSGNVTLRVPSSFGAQLDIETGSGDINSDLPITITRHSSDMLRGTIGDGRGNIKVETGSGSVRIVAANTK